MGVYKHSPFYWMALEGFVDARGNPLRESTRVRHDAPTPDLGREAAAQASKRYHERMIELAGQVGPGTKPRVLLRDFLDWYDQHKMPARRDAEREREITSCSTSGAGPRSRRSGRVNHT